MVVQFCNIRTYKSGPNTSCFVHFHFWTCLSPQARAFFQHQNLQKWSKHVMFCTFSLPNVPFATGACIFQHQNLQKWSKHVMFCAFSLPNVPFATAACIFSTSELTKVVRAPHVLYIFTSECAFRHSGVQFLISPLSSDLRTRRFNRPTFRLTWHTNHWKNTAFRDFSNIWRGCIFFLLTFALLHLLSADLTTLLCFSTVHIVGSLLFKLPSISQFGSIPQIGVKTKNIWNHHPPSHYCREENWETPISPKPSPVSVKMPRGLPISHIITIHGDFSWWSLRSGDFFRKWRGITKVSDT